MTPEMRAACATLPGRARISFSVSASTISVFAVVSLCRLPVRISSRGALVWTVYLPLIRSTHISSSWASVDKASRV